MTYNPTNNSPSYKHFHGAFKKDTNDYHVGKNGIEPWDMDSLTEYCTDHFEYILRNNDYTHVFQILKKFFKFFDCRFQSEFEEIVLIPLLRKLCTKHRKDFDQVEKNIVENKCISYHEDFN